MQSQPQQNSKSSQSLATPSASNLELYKQLDQLREENFQLKQKQRELILNMNQLRGENEQLLDNAESEIKRMSDFVDKFTQESEAAKKKIAADYEQKISQEKQKADDLRQKLSLEKNDLELKFQKLQKEAEALKQENMSL